MAKLRVLVAGGRHWWISPVCSALRRRGIDVQLFEQATAFGMVGARDIQYSSNAAKNLAES